MFNRDADIGDELVGTEGEERAALTHIHGGCSSVTKSRLTLCDTRDLAHQTPLPLGFPGQEYQSGLPFPSPKYTLPSVKRIASGKFSRRRWWSRTCLSVQVRRNGGGFNPWVGKSPWRRAWLPPPVFLPGESHGRRRLAGYSPHGSIELGTTEVT